MLATTEMKIGENLPKTCTLLTLPKGSRILVMYNIKIKQFEGPLELLADLIGKEELNITRISLAQVADQYLEYLEKNESINLANLADFLTVASKLILIKSKSLLPLLVLSDEEEEEILDLEQQLMEYKKFKDASLKLGKIMESDEYSISRESFLDLAPVFSPPSDLKVAELMSTYEEILSEIPVIEDIEEERVKEVVSLKEKIDNLRTFLKEKIETSFHELVGESKDKVEVIVSFLAMLEMAKQRIVVVEQEGMFNDIKLRVNKRENIV